MRRAATVKIGAMWHRTSRRRLCSRGSWSTPIEAVGIAVVDVMAIVDVASPILLALLVVAVMIVGLVVENVVGVAV